MTRPELESALETRCVARIEAQGGLALKLRPPTGRGFPDRTVLIPGKLKSNDHDRRDWQGSYERSRVFFLEFKRPKLGVVAAQQSAWRRMLTLAGFGVYFCDSDEAFETALQREMSK